MKGSVISKLSGDTTGAARCPGPTKPGAACGTFTTRLIPRRCDMFPPSVIDLSGSFGNRLLDARFAPFKPRPYRRRRDRRARPEPRRYLFHVGAHPDLVQFAALHIL